MHIVLYQSACLSPIVMGNFTDLMLVYCECNGHKYKQSIVYFFCLKMIKCTERDNIKVTIYTLQVLVIVVSVSTAEDS